MGDIEGNSAQAEPGQGGTVELQVRPLTREDIDDIMAIQEMVYGEELLEDRAVFERAISAAEYLHEQSPAVKPSPNGSGCARGATGQSGWGGARSDDEETEEVDKNEFEDQQGLCLGGFTRCEDSAGHASSEKLVGYMISHLMASDHIPAFGVPPPKVQPAEATALYIHDVAIVPEARGTGLGRKLVEALDTAEQPLVCVAVQNAHGFWERMGFARKGPAEEFGYGEASAVMVRDVDGTDAGKGDEGVAGAGKVAP